VLLKAIRVPLCEIIFSINHIYYRDEQTGAFTLDVYLFPAGIGLIGPTVSAAIDRPAVPVE
jgi:hypothetical protein